MKPEKRLDPSFNWFAGAALGELAGLAFQPEKEMTIMAFRDLIPWSRQAPWSRQENRLPVPVSAERGRDNDTHPPLSLHREVNRLFDNVFRGFGVPAFAGFDHAAGWPHVELGETDKEIRVTAELPGLDEKDVEITVEDGALRLRGEKRSEVEDKDRGYTERSYGRFERRIGLPQGVDRDNANDNHAGPCALSALPPGAQAVIEPVPRATNRGGRGPRGQWRVRFVPRWPPVADPLTGWTGGGDPLETIELRFPDLTTAADYCQRQGLDFSIHGEPLGSLALRACLPAEPAPVLCCWPTGPHALRCGAYPIDAGKPDCHPGFSLAG